jgi:hypothetical protein
VTDGYAEVVVRKEALGADPSARNIHHILQLPGTVNWPNAKKRKAGQVPVLSQLIAFNPKATYALEDFPAYLDKEQLPNQRWGLS